MDVPELLAPAGGMDALLAAVAAGADAVYTGVGAYSARAASAGLSVEELGRACALAHVHGVRVYVALNALVAEYELAGALELARRSLAAGADALIVADVGLARALVRELPGVELHLSTQAGVQSVEAAALAARELGCSRVTVARELSLEELAAMCAAGVPVEAFCHGAICVCYSGACAFSALRRGRSANRGDCTQPCRMAYSLVDGAGAVLAGGGAAAGTGVVMGGGRLSDAAAGRESARGAEVPKGSGTAASDGTGAGAAAAGDRLLCPRDYLGVAHMARLAAAGVASFKIEGRMKNSDYVYNVVRCYREVLDAVAVGRAVDAQALEARLARSFNRGFTDAYLRGARGAGLGAEFMSFERACNQGAYVGRLLSQHGSEALVQLERDVDAGDVLEIRSTPGAHAFPDAPKRWPQVPVAAGASAGELLRVHCKRRVEPGSAAHVVRSARLLAEAEEAVAAFRAELDGPAGAEGLGTARPASRRSRAAVAGAQPNAAPTGFEPVRAVGPAQADGGAATGAGGASAAAAGSPTASAAASAALAAGSPSAGAEDALLYLATSPHDAARALAAGTAEVGVCAWRLEEPGGLQAWEPLAPEFALVLDEVHRACDTVRVREWCAWAARADMRAVVCRNLGQIDLARAAGLPWEAAAPLNVWNAESARWLAGLGCRRIWLPDELSGTEEAALDHALGGAVPLGRLAGPRRQLMVTERCVLTAEGPCSGACAACSRRAAAQAGHRFLVEADGARLPIEVDVHGRTRIYQND